MTARPIGQSNGDVVTEFVDVADTGVTTWTYSTTQNRLHFVNRGNQAITINVGGTGYTVSPGASRIITADFTSFTTQSASKTQEFDARAIVLATPNGVDAVARANIAQVQTSLNNIGDGTPKEIFATLAALQAAYPTGKVGLMLVTADGKIYYWNGSAWTAGPQYQSTGIPDNSLTVDKTDFARRINVFDFNNITVGRLQLTVGTNRYTDIYAPDTACRVSKIYNISPGDIVRIKFVNQATYATNICFYDNTGLLLYSEKAPNYSTSLQATAPAGTAFMRFTVTNGAAVSGSDWTTVTMCTINREMPASFVSYTATEIPSLQVAVPVDTTLSARVDALTDTREVGYFLPNEFYYLKGFLPNRYVPITNIIVGKNRRAYTLKTYNDRYSPVRDSFVRFDGNAASAGYFNLVKRIDGLDTTIKSITTYWRCVDPTTKANPSSAKNVLMLGDSFTAGGYFPSYIKKYLSDNGFTNFNFVGSKTSSVVSGVTVKHSGYGGYSVKDFLKTTNTGGGGVSFPNPMLSGSVVALENMLPEIPDIVILELGINDMLNFAYNLSDLATDYANLITIIRNRNPACQIYMVGYIFMNDLNTNTHPDYHNLYIQKANTMLQTIAASTGNSKYVDVSIMFQTEYGFPFTMIPAYPGSTEMIKNQTDYLHPSELGYAMEAECVSAAMIYDL